ncbi:hypothetical protein B9Z55_018909 [Caenorhabditis nigoni]|nr:hypothetical protein B9Z55_018909 [Caenorhabditis nigoni]
MSVAAEKNISPFSNITIGDKENQIFFDHIFGVFLLHTEVGWPSVKDLSLYNSTVVFILCCLILIVSKINVREDNNLTISKLNVQICLLMAFCLFQVVSLVLGTAIFLKQISKPGSS